MTKQELRQEIRRRKAACPIEKQAALSALITARLQQHPRWSSARTVLLYHSLPDEVNTHHLISESLEQGKCVLLPVVVGDDLELREFPYQSSIIRSAPRDALRLKNHQSPSLREGAFHILEPTGPLFTDYDAIDLAVIPGVAFTLDGCRLGRGRGYYDRLLARLNNLQSSIINHQSLYTLGLAFPFQILDDLPTEPHDIKLDEVITIETI